MFDLVHSKQMQENGLILNTFYSHKYQLNKNPQLDKNLIKKISQI